MRIVNLIHIGDQVLSLDDMDPMKKTEIALRLNEQSLKTLGYALYVVLPDTTLPFYTISVCVQVSPPGHHVEGMDKYNRSRSVRGVI